MLHSYGGSADLVKGLLAIHAPSACMAESIGRRLFFSFSTAIGDKVRDKMKERIAAVPDDRLLVETDLIDTQRMNEALCDIIEVVAEVKLWSVPETIDRTWANFCAFYDGFLPEDP